MNGQDAETRRMPRIQPIDRESPFAPEELFFSTTDRQGRIRSGNDVFARVARYALAEMLDRPHSLIRHPDMPRAVFQLLWDTILAGRPIAAYVQNMASDGSYYWVLATVAPIPGSEGFVSVRLKPTSDQLAAIQSAYRAMREVEREHEARGDRAAGIEASTAMLPSILASLGHADYESFMHAALPLEIRARDQVRARSPLVAAGEADGPLALVRERCVEVSRSLNRQFGAIDGLLDHSGEFEQKSRFVSELARRVRLASLNATAAASRLGPDGAALALIASSIGESAETGSELAAGLERRNRLVTGLLRRAAFHTGMARLQLEMARGFVDEQILAAGDGGAPGEGMRALFLALEASVREVFDTCAELDDALVPLGDELHDLRRLVQLLRVTHISGLIEANRSDDAGFRELLSDVGHGVEQAHAELQSFHRSIEATREGIDDIAGTQRPILEGMGSIVAAVAC